VESGDARNKTGCRLADGPLLRVLIAPLPGTENLINLGATIKTLLLAVTRSASQAVRATGVAIRVNSICFQMQLHRLFQLARWFPNNALSP
jgi:hypothetical protein